MQKTLPKMNYPYTLIRSKRKTICISINQKGEIIVKCPFHMKTSSIDAFLLKHKDWIEKQLSAIRERKQTGIPIILNKNDIQQLKVKATAYILPLVERYGLLMNVHEKHIKITSARTRWGSCNGENGICFSYRIMLLPPECIEYIVVHELAHIRVKNHGPLFYSEIERYMPDYKDRYKKLRAWERSHLITYH